MLNTTRIALLRLKAIHPAKTFVFRSFSSRDSGGAYKKGEEPPYQISLDVHEVDLKSIQVPVLRDATRVAMYQKYKSDPSLWTIDKLSQEYGTSRDRTNAVIYLMTKREEMQRKLGVFDMTAEHKAMYEKHMADPENATPSSLSEEYGMNLEQVNQILANLGAHYARLGTLEASENHMATVLAGFEEEGLDTSFREIPSEGKLEGSYYPRFFKDHEEEENIRVLKQMIVRDTKAKVEPSVDDFFRNSSNSEEEGLHPPLPSEQPNNANVKTNTLSRWKFAFRDTSKSLQEGRPMTMVRTRRGGWRAATPLEESQRSWSPKPTHLNHELNKHRYEKFLDPDADEKEAASLPRKKKLALEEKKAKKAALAN